MLKEKLYQNKPSNQPLIVIPFVFFISLLIYLSYNLKTFDVVEVYGIREDDIIRIAIPYNKVDILNKNPEIKYNNKTYKIENLEYEDAYLNNGIPYEDITIDNNISAESRIVNLKIIYDKQRIINKLKKVILERTTNE